MAEWQRTLGRTGLPVTAVGLGLAALGRPGYLNLGHGDDLGADRSRRGAASATRTRCSTPPTPRGVRYFDAARSYGRAEEFLGRRGCDARRPGDVTVGSKWGYTYTADWRGRRRPARGQGPRAETFRRQIAETRDAARRPPRRSTRSTRPRSRAACSTTARCSTRWRELRADGVAIGLTATGPRQADTIEPRARGRRLRHGAGDLEPARALGRAGARPRARRRAGRDRQGGAGQRPADGPRRRAELAARGAASAAPRRTRSRSPPCSRSPGSTSC